MYSRNQSIGYAIIPIVVEEINKQEFIGFSQRFYHQSEYNQSIYVEKGNVILYCVNPSHVFI